MWTQVASGQVHLFNETQLHSNSAPDGAGSSIYLSPNGTLRYTLPALAGHWLNIRQGITFEMSAGPEDLDFPYACSPGIVGGYAIEEQSGPGCSRPWYDSRAFSSLACSTFLTAFRCCVQFAVLRGTCVLLGLFNLNHAHGDNM
jgi:hypothetical protein